MKPYFFAFRLQILSPHFLAFLSPVISVAALIGLGLALILIALALLLRQRKAAAGNTEVMRRVAYVEQALDPEGTVIVGGELWCARARAGEHIMRGTRVRIVATRGHWLEVEECAEALK